MFTNILCGECGGVFARMGDDLHGDYAKCEDCGHEVSVELDIVPNLDDGESIVWGFAPTAADPFRNVLGYTTEES